MYEILLLRLILNGIEIDDVEWNLPRNCWLYESIDIDRHAVGEKQLIHSRGISGQSSCKIVTSCLWQPLFKISKAVFHHHFVPSRNIGLFFPLFNFIEAFRVQLASKLLVWFANNPRQSLEVSNVEPVLRSFNEYFIQERLDDFPLGFLNIIAGEARESRSNHVPCSNRFFCIKVCRWSSKRVDTERQPLAPQRRPNSHFTHIE